MPRLNQRPVAQHPAGVDHDAAMTVCGRDLIRVDGVWCGRTQAGTWRPARWLHQWPTELLEVIWAMAAWDQPEPAPADDVDQLTIYEALA